MNGGSGQSYDYLKRKIPFLTSVFLVLGSVQGLGAEARPLSRQVREILRNRIERADFPVRIT